MVLAVAMTKFAITVKKRDTFLGIALYNVAVVVVVVHEVCLHLYIRSAITAYYVSLLCHSNIICHHYLRPL